MMEVHYGGNTLPDFELSIPDGYEIRDGLNIQDKKFYKNEEYIYNYIPYLFQAFQLNKKTIKYYWEGKKN